MKRIMTTLLTACLLLQLCTGFAVPIDGTEAFVQTAKASVSQNETSQEVDSSVEIEVRSSLFSPCKGTVSVEISNSTTKQTKELDFSDTSTVSHTAKFGVQEGEYTITILADKFAKYQQNVTVKSGWMHRLLVCSSKTDTKSGAKLGWIQAGDVNGDKIINEKDTNQIVSDIHHKPESISSDINNDGKTDIADLQYLVQNMGAQMQESIVEHLKIAKAIHLTGVEVTEGSVTGLISGQGGATLRLINAPDGAVISDEYPATMDFELANDNEAPPEIGGITLFAPSEMDEDGSITSNIAKGNVEVHSNDGSVLTIPLNETNNASLRKSIKSFRTVAKTGTSVTTNEDGSLVINFGSQIAVKRITIKITGTKKQEPLIHIAKVEFVNKMDERIPAPSLDIPALSSPKAGNQQLDVSWSAQNNVTGYELYVSGPVKGKPEDSQIISVASNKYTISMINNASLLNFEKYTIKVRSVNGDWRSPWSMEITGIPKPQKKPAPPDNVTVAGGYRSIHVSWKKMDDSSYYMVYYKKADEAQDKYRPVLEGFEPDKYGTDNIKDCIAVNNYIIENLEDETEYSVYVIGWNELGWGGSSLVSIGKTKSSNPPELPAYKLLNTSNGEGKVSAHIKEVAIGGHGGAKMVGSPLDTKAKSGLGLVDNDYNSYWSKTDWDDGVAYPANDRGMFITLDDDYKMNYITFAAFNEASSLNTVRIEYWNTGTGNERKVVGARMLRKLDRNQKQFYIVKFDETVTANKVHISLGRSSSNRAEMKVGEIRFYKYDSLEDDIMGLYSDEMHTTLKSGVTSETISLLEERLETPDEESGEKHPLYSELKLEIGTAKDILENNPSPSYEVINQITGKKDGHLGFSGLNSWQPLGKTVYAGETLVVYVGHNTKRTNDSTNLQLVMTQYHSESNSLAKTSAALKIGRNVITVPQITRVCLKIIHLSAICLKVNIILLKFHLLY